MTEAEREREGGRGGKAEAVRHVCQSGGKSIEISQSYDILASCW